ncbi:MAG TPA: gephyrin-like molybdotransferase Glp [Dehalococcoidales bacterium]
MAEALDAILSRISVLAIEEKPLLEAPGRVAAQDYLAEFNVPAWDSSAKDGFAVRAEDIRGASLHNPFVLEVIETVTAGSSASRMITGGTAVRIMTGAPLPLGADCVVGFEDTTPGVKSRPKSDAAEPEISIIRQIARGENIHRAGHQIFQGELLAAVGAVIGPAQAALLGSSGLAGLRVFKQPVIAIIATGSELVSPGRTLKGPHIYSGNSFSLAAQVKRCGGIPKLLGIAKDTESALTAKLKRGMKADLVLTTGGVAGGDRDLVKTVMADLGEVVFREVRMMPGKSTGFGLLHSLMPDGKVRLIPHVALSGNPPAVFAGFEVLVRPAILKMAGRADVKPGIVLAKLDERIIDSGSFQRFVWVKVVNRGGFSYAKPTGTQSGGTLRTIADANGLAIIPENTAESKKGDLVRVMTLDWN